LKTFFNDSDIPQLLCGKQTVCPCEVGVTQDPELQGSSSILLKRVTFYYSLMCKFFTCTN